MSLAGLLMAGRFVKYGSGEFITRTEYMITENARIISFVCLVASIVLGRVGCKTIKAVNKANPEFANVVFKKNLFRVALVFVMCLVAHHYKREVHNIMNQGQRINHHEPQPIDMEVMPSPEDNEIFEPTSEDYEEFEDLEPEDFEDEIEEQNFGRHLEAETTDSSNNRKIGDQKQRPDQKSRQKSKRSKRVKPTLD